MIRPPPRSTLTYLPFPYTTLFLSSAQRRAGASGLASLSFRRAFPLPSLPFRHGLGLIKAKTQRIHNGVAHHRRGHGEQDQAADKRSGQTDREKIERRR